MKKVVSILLILVMELLLLVPNVFAADESTKIVLSDNQITVNGEAISTNSSQTVYLSSKMDNGGTSSDATKENIEISNIVNITKAGTYELSGELSDGQISINANGIDGEVKIVLNNVKITCKSAPAIFVYSKDIENSKCTVKIETTQDSENVVTGGKIKTSVEGWEDQDSIIYYVEKGYSDENEYYERYKYDGAISSDVSLVFEGNGYLNVVSSKKEGIEGKGDITFNSGVIYVDSLDDGINACTDNKSNIVVNGGTVVVKVNEKAEEGDGIDSNGKLTINGGTVYAFAHPGSDNGMDADQGVYINGGTVLSTGDMQEQFKSSNNKKIIQMQLSSKVNEGDTIVVVDKNGEAVFAFKTNRTFSAFGYSSEDLKDEDYSVYTGTDVTGTVDDDGVYVKVDSANLNNLTKQEGSSTGMMGRQNGGMPGDFENRMNNKTSNNEYFIYVIGGYVAVLAIVVIAAFVASKKKNK